MGASLPGRGSEVGGLGAFFVPSWVSCLYGQGDSLSNCTGRDEVLRSICFWFMASSFCRVGACLVLGRLWGVHAFWC